MNKNLALGSILLCAYMLVGFFGPLSILTMDHHSSQQTEGCPFMTSQSVLCTMSPLEHLSSWQIMTTIIPKETSLLVLIISFAFLAVIFFRSLFAAIDQRSRFYRLLYFWQSLHRLLLLKSVISPRGP
jgi:hypothetical protein